MHFALELALGGQSGAMTANLPAILQEAARSLGYSLYPEQKLAVTSFVEGSDVFLSLPTGFGKSLCFAILPLVFDCLRNSQESIVLVVSPLLSIIEDQISIYRKKGMKVGYAGGEDKDEKEGIKRGEYQIVFISPESLFCTTEWRQMLCSAKYRSHLVGVVVDEAHCIKKWYLELHLHGIVVLCICILYFSQRICPVGGTEKPCAPKCSRDGHDCHCDKFD